MGGVDERGHGVVPISRTHGIDLTTAVGLEQALTGVDCIIDAATGPSPDEAEATSFFTAASRNLHEAGHAAGVSRMLVVSIVGIDRWSDGYGKAKLAHEQTALAGPVPTRILRATQFHEFPAQLLARVRGPVAPVPVMRTQPVAAREVAEHLVRLATGDPVGHARELAGPEVHDLPDLARRVLAARGTRRIVVPVRTPGPVGSAMAGDGLLPRSDGPRGVQTFSDWLATSL